MLCAGSVEKSAAAVDKGVQDTNKRTALHFAAGEGQTDVCKFLIEQRNKSCS